MLADDLGAYLDGVTVSELGRVAETLAVLDELDPGSELVLRDVALPDPPARALVEAARGGEVGATLVLQAAPDGVAITAAHLAPLVLLARELRGDVSYDPYSTPAVTPEQSGRAAWSFVRGEDLGLRVIVDAGEPPADTGAPVVVEFSDPLLTAPKLFDPATGEASLLYGGQRTRGGYRLSVDEPRPAFLLAFERAATSSVTGVESVEERARRRRAPMPVEEILRRLQAFEDAQARRLEHYQAINTTHLRFQVGASSQSFEATLQGPFFWQRRRAPTGRGRSSSSTASAGAARRSPTSR